MSRLLIGIVRLYQMSVGRLLGGRCRFYPTCSNYAIAAIRVNGPVVGLAQAGWRLLRCGPWTRGGVDHPAPVGRRHRLGRAEVGN